MKLKSEIPHVRERFKAITNLPEYAAKLKANGNYKDSSTTATMTTSQLWQRQF